MARHEVMIPLDKLNGLFRPVRLTRRRKILALALAVAADVLQIMLLPVAWAGAQQIIDVMAMVITMFLLGFHVLLLPTFAIEFVPVLDMIPTWTGCVIAVIALRRNEQSPPPATVLDADNTLSPKQISAPSSPPATQPPPPVL